jgi:hypothetical protein
MINTMALIIVRWGLSFNVEKMKIKLAYFNLISLIGYFANELSHGSVNPILAIGLMVTLWYNWETLKRLKGLPGKFNKINILIGAAVLLFSALMTAEGYHKIIIRYQFSNLAEGLIFLALIEIIIGFSNLLITAKTINIYWKPQTS